MSPVLRTPHSAIFHKLGDGVLAFLVFLTSFRLLSRQAVIWQAATSQAGLISCSSVLMGLMVWQFNKTRRRHELLETCKLLSAFISNDEKAKPVLAANAQRLLETHSDLIVYLDTNGWVLSANEEFIQLQGRPEEALRGEAFAGMLGAADFGPFSGNGVSSPGQSETVVMSQNSTLSIHWVIRAIPLQKGQAVTYLAIGRGSS